MAIQDMTFWQIVGWLLIIGALGLYLWWKGYKYPKIKDRRREFYKKYLGGERCVIVGMDHYSCQMNVAYGSKVYDFRGTISWFDNRGGTIQLSHMLKIDPPSQAHQMAMDELRCLRDNINATKKRGE